MSDLPDDDQLLAAELAFGLIDGAEAKAAEARLAADPAFAETYARWLDYAAAMFTDPGEAPRPSVWTAIEARLPANDQRRAPSLTTLRWWQSSALVASAAALVLAVILVERAPRAPVIAPAPIAQPAPQAPLVAVLTGDNKGVLTISFDRVSGRLTAAPSGMHVGAHSAELWVIPADGKPRSLGVVAAGAPGWTRAPGAAASAIAPGVTLAITVEPVGGSPSGKPTGPVILTGKVSAT